MPKYILKVQKNVKQWSQSRYFGLVHIRAGWLCLYYASLCYFIYLFLFSVYKVRKIQLCPLSSVLAIGKQSAGGLT